MEFGAGIHQLPAANMSGHYQHRFLDLARNTFSCRLWKRDEVEYLNEKREGTGKTWDYPWGQIYLENSSDTCALGSGQCSPIKYDTLRTIS
jgi:hypothetical protein